MTGGWLSPSGDASGPRPLIGITLGTAAPACDAAQRGEPRPGWFLPAGYARAVAAAGGLPVALPPADPDLADAVLARLDGLLLSGGPDVDPAWYGEAPRPELGRVDPERDAWEIALVRAALALDVPVLGICRGVQVMNASLGGTLLQDIPAQVAGALRHQRAGSGPTPTHGVEVAPDSLLAGLLVAGGAGPGRPARDGASPLALRVNSRHHQAVRDPAPPFRVVAWAGDGVIEAIESPGPGFAVGVQWHPEDMADEGSRNLFRGLIEAARARRAAREGCSVRPVLRQGGSGR